MKQNLILILLLSFLSLFNIGCKSTAYFKDRGKDAADIFTLTAGVGFGGKVRIGPIEAGLGYEAPTYGLRGGNFLNYKNCNVSDAPSFGMDMQILYSGIDIFTPFNNSRNKGYGAKPIFLSEEEGPNGFYDLFLTVPFLRNAIVIDQKDDEINYSYYTQVELYFGLLGTIRIGFNIGELFDFILGWTTLDIYNDDIYQKNYLEK